MTKKKGNNDLISNLFKEDPNRNKGQDLSSTEAGKNINEPDHLPNLTFRIPAGSSAPENELKAYWRNLRMFFRTGKFLKIA